MSGTEAAPRRFLIATAVSHYPHAPEWDRPGLVEARRQVVELFTGTLGYEHVSDLGLNPTKHQLQRELREFCRSPERRPDDIVAVYVAGHGEVLDNGDYVLLTSDTEPDDLYDALLPYTLARKILAGTKVRRLLLMLDTCFSGQGGNELLASMAKLKNDWREKDSGLAVITSAQPTELAQTGAFPELLSDAVHSLATAGYTPRVLALDAVVNATRTHPKRPGFQHIGLEIIGLTGEIPPFLPNAKHSPRLSHTDMALQQAAEWDEQGKRRDVEFRTRLLRRAMGHRDEHRVGWWFSGRHRALEDITGWLGALPAGRPALVVTGGPGSGKTAVLGLLAAVSDPEYRRTVPLATLGLTSDQLPAPRAIRTAVYAQNLTDQQIVRAFAAALRLPPTESVADLLNHLGAGPEPHRPHVLLIDGLDEAATPSALCGQVLRPLMELAAPHLRLLLGTRPHLLTPLGLNREDHIDLDAPRYADPDAVLAYTLRNLIDAHPDTPYLTCPSGLRLDVARAVAEAADRSFLVARITAGTLAATPTLPDPRDRAWRTSLPRAAADAIHRDLHQRFGDTHAETILALLRPLAYAEGQGLPWEDIWAPLASELSGRRYTNQDLHQLRRDAGAYVVEAVEDGRSVYRLYHEAMAEYLRLGQDAEHAHRAFTTALRRAVPYRLDGAPDWARAHPYALRHLATHASHAGVLDELVADSEYLVHAESDTLALHLLEAGTDTAELHSAIYRASINVHRHLDPSGRRQLLAVDAARHNARPLLEALNGRTAERAWKPVAASGSRLSSNARTALTGHTDCVDAVACTQLDGRPVAVSGARDNTVRVWDLATGRPVGQQMTGHTAPVEAIACTELNGRPVAVTGSADRTVRVWDLTTRRPVGHPLTGHTDAVASVTCTLVDGRPVAVTGSPDETVRVWDLATGRPTAEPIKVGWRVDAVACSVLAGRPVAVLSRRESLEIWDLTTHTSLRRVPCDTWTWISGMACTEVDGRPIAVTGEQDGGVRVWDLQDGREAARLEGHSDWVWSVACAEVDGRPVAVTASSDHTARVWDLQTLQAIGPPLRGHTNNVASVSCASLGGRAVAVTGSLDETVRIWDLSPRRPLGRRVIGHTREVNSMDSAVVNGRRVLVTGADDARLLMWDRDTGLPLGEPLDGHTKDVWSVFCTTLAGRPVAVSSSLDDTVRVWDLRTGREACPPLQGHANAVTEVACTVVNGRPVAVGASLDTTVLVWDLLSGRTLYSPLEGHSRWVSAVACTTVDGRPVAVTSSEDGTVRTWDLSTGEPVHAVSAHWAEHIACAVVDGRPVAVTCSRDATLRMWDLRTGLAVGQPMTSHDTEVWTVTCAELDGRPVAVTGSDDGTVRIWDLGRRATVDVVRVPGSCRALALDDTGLLACSFSSDVAFFRR